MTSTMDKVKHKLDDLAFIRLALKEAEKASSKNEVPIGAILVVESIVPSKESIFDRQITRGHNLRESRFDPLGHAELLVIKKASKKLKSWRLSSNEFRSTLYVTLEPCPMCLAACQQARVNRVVYAAHDLKGGAISNQYHLHADSKLNHRFSVDFVEVKEASEMLSAFFRALRASKRRIQ